MVGGGPASFSADELGFAAKRDGLQFPDHVLNQLVAALDSGMHVVLTGPAGTGKTTLAHLVADLAQQAMLCTGYLPATATAEWSVAQTIGSIQDTAEGHVFLPGMVLESIESGCWLVIDELNRADVDSALGELLTVVSGQPVVLPFKRHGGVLPLSLVPAGAATPADTDVIRVPATWRMVATMGSHDDQLPMAMSRALLRRFAFVEVPSPDDDAFAALLEGPGEIVRRLLPLRAVRDIGPAVFLDAARFAARRAEDAPTSSRLLFEAFTGFLLPQLRGIDAAAAATTYHLVAEVLSDPERAEARRAITEATHP